MNHHTRRRFSLIDSLRRGQLNCLIAVLVLLHLLSFITGAIFIGGVFLPLEEYEASSCVRRGLEGGCYPVEIIKGGKASLESRVFSFKFPNVSDFQLSTWNWRLMGDVTLDATFRGPEIPEDAAHGAEDADDSNKGNSTRVFVLEQRVFPVVVTLNLEASTSGEWRKEASLVSERDLLCTLSRPRADLVEKKEMLDTAQYICSGFGGTGRRLLEIYLPQNKIYALSLEIALPNRLKNESASLHPFFHNKCDAGAVLSAVIESRTFHIATFYAQCIFCPFVLTALALFGSSVYANDLYISIPDRALMAAASIQLLQNIPIKAVASVTGLASMKIVDEIFYCILTAAFLVLWLVFAKDKLSSKEPWERNTKYYFRQLTLVCLGGSVAILFAIYVDGFDYNDPLSVGAGREKSTSFPSFCLAFAFGLVVAIMIFQIYFAVLVFKIVCTTQKCGYATKTLVLYCFAASLSASAGFVCRIAIKLRLDLNLAGELNTGSLSETAGILYFGQQLFWNIHITALLILLRRKKSEELFFPVPQFETKVEEEEKEGDVEDDVTPEIEERENEDKGEVMYQRQFYQTPFYHCTIEEESEFEDNYHLVCHENEERRNFDPCCDASQGYCHGENPLVALEEGQVMMIERPVDEEEDDDYYTRMTREDSHDPGVATSEDDEDDDEDDFFRDDEGEMMTDEENDDMYSREQRFHLLTRTQSSG